MQQLTEQQVQNWINSIFVLEGPEDGEHSVSPVARFTTLALADVPYIPTYSTLSAQCLNLHMRKFRTFLDEVVRVMDECGVRPWTNDDDEKGRPSP